jgi:hypothetical protein
MPHRELNLESNIQNFVAQLEQLFGSELVSITLYGSAAGVDYSMDRSDLNFLVLLKKVDSEKLKQAQKFTKNWQQRRIAAPLLLDTRTFELSVALFPMEFLEMKEQHESLFGVDPLAKLEVFTGHLRLQCEQELKGKQLRLPMAYIETQGKLALTEALLVGAVKSFGVIMRTLLRLKKIQPAREFLEILNQIEELFSIELEGFRRTHQIRMGFQHLDEEEAERLFFLFWQDVNRLADKAEALFRS